MVHPGEQAEEGRATHYQVEVSYHEVGVVHLNVEGSVAQDDTCQTTR
jgi:hypothetical protein